jgi:predicted small lipoprotein YifL
MTIMALPSLRPVLLVTALALAVPALTGCGLVGGGSEPPAEKVDESPQRARERVQGYLDAMKAKDVPTGRAQLCAPLHAAFDKVATSANGDFADHFTVEAATITDIRAAGDGQQVSTSITVTAKGQRIPLKLLFTVTRAGDGTDAWCIAGEEVGGNASPTPGAEVTP